MGERERKVEQYLNQQIRKLGGITRKWVSPSHAGVPDRICIIPMKATVMIKRLQQLHPDTIVACYKLVEAKTARGRLSGRQHREHCTLNKKGATTIVVYGKEDVDKLIENVAFY